MNDDADAETVIRMAEECANRAPLELVLSATAAVQLAGLLQLAMRHPQLDQNNRRTALMVVDHVRAYFGHSPRAAAVLDVMRRGDDPASDREWPR